MKFIFVTGGVVSSLGKGIVTASLAALLRSPTIIGLKNMRNFHPITGREQQITTNQGR